MSNESMTVEISLIIAAEEGYDNSFEEPEWVKEDPIHDLHYGERAKKKPNHPFALTSPHRPQSASNSASPPSSPSAISPSPYPHPPYLRYFPSPSQNSSPWRAQTALHYSSRYD